MIRLLTRGADDITAQATRLLPALQTALAAWPLGVAVEPLASQIGSGSLPVDRLPSARLVMRPQGKRAGILHTLEERLRGLPVPVIGHIADDALRFDLRCLGAHEEIEFIGQLPLLGGPKR